MGLALAFGLGVVTTLLYFRGIARDDTDYKQLLKSFKKHVAKSWFHFYRVMKLDGRTDDDIICRFIFIWSQNSNQTTISHFLISLGMRKTILEAIIESGPLSGDEAWKIAREIDLTQYDSLLHRKYLKHNTNQ